MTGGPDTPPRSRPAPSAPLVLLAGCAVVDAVAIAVAVNTRQWVFLAIHVVGTIAVAGLLVYGRRRTRPPAATPPTTEDT